MAQAILSRTLWYEEQDEVVEVDQRFLMTGSRPLVVLGEAGMGKSTLLISISSEADYSFCTARQLINRAAPHTLLGDATTLVIDALDEVSASREGDAVDLVLRKLGELGYPRFILSCRVADWRSATALQGIRDHYPTNPLELHLNPLGRVEALNFLQQTLTPGLSETVISHLEQRGLDGLWRNPQTLQLVQQVAVAGELPKSKGDLFASAVPLLRAEHREEKGNTPLAALPEEDVLDAAGAAFAALIINGGDALSRRVQTAQDDLPLAEISALPGANRLPETLGSRLFEARGPERFTYTHRAIGEFLGARWLAKHASTRREERRLLALFHARPLVPASLRGIHAWLAWHSPTLAPAVIGADPMGVIEYGDADILTIDQGRSLLNALGELSEENPRFREWRPYSVGGIVQKALLPEIRDLLTAPTTEFGLRLLVLQALKNSPLATELADTLKDLLLDQRAIFANRSEAGDRLTELDSAVSWPDIARTLIDQNDENGVRLAMEMMGEVGFELFDAKLLIDAAFAQIPRAEHHVGVFYRFERKVPDALLDELLDLLTTRARALGEPHHREGDSQLTDLTYGLIARRLKLGPIEPSRLWGWLEPFDSQTGYLRESRAEVADWFRKHDEARQAIQRHVLFELPGDKTVWQRAWRLSKRSEGLAATEQDVLVFFHALDPNNRQDERWRDVVQLAAHSESEGAEVREAARRFAIHRPDMLAWIDKLAEPRVYEWQVKREEEERKRRAKRATQWAEHRADYEEHITQIVAGEYGYVVNPAKAYLKLFSDMGDDAADGPARLVEWLGSRLAEACLAGFEAFLVQSPTPSASEISESHAEGRRWPAADIIVAALAERLRTGRGFSDLPDERLMAGLFVLFQTKVDDHAGIVGLEEELASGLRSRGSWESAIRLFYEPQFARRLTHVDRLYSLVRDDNDADLAIRLSAEWLMAYPDMPEIPESELIDRLIRSDQWGTLNLIQQARLSDATLNNERRRNWLAVALIVNFQSALATLSKGEIEPELLWHLRARIGDRRRDQRAGDLTAVQLNWIITTFRPLFPERHRPNTVTTGDTNPWDATEYLNALIGRLGNYTSDEAIADVARLRDAPADGYTEYLRVVAAEQRRNRVEAEFIPPTLDDIKAVVTDAPPTDAVQLQQVILEELVVVQAKVRGSDLDWYKDFYSDAGNPRIEDDCRDAVLKVFGTLPFGIHALPEGHIADDKRCDVICLLGNLMVPIEIKGQWHSELWTAADRQLDRLYVNDWRAECGIYLVLWFGPGTSKSLKSPPSGIPKPTTAEELRQALVAGSSAAQTGRLEVVVLDLTRPGA